MGCGKTTHGKKLAKLLSCQFVDLDKEIETHYQKTIAQLFQVVGEQQFREIETEALKKITQKEENTIVSLGGGTPCFNDNLSILKENGLLIYIEMDAKSLYNRLKNAAKKRPLLKGKTDDELLQYISDLLSVREKYYHQAHVTVNGLNLTDYILRESIHNYQNQE